MAKVLIRFTDRETRKNYQVGDDYTGSGARIKHLAGLGYIIEEAGASSTVSVKAKKPKKTK